MYPLATANPFSAEIGTKEGVQNGDKFDVLAPAEGKVKGTYEFKKVGSLSVDKKAVVWDNDGDVEEPKVAEDGTVAEVIKATPLKGKGKKLKSTYYIRLAD